MGHRYESYQKSLIELDIQTLEERREVLCLTFAQRCLKNDKAMKMFPLNNKINDMKTSKQEFF